MIRNPKIPTLCCCGSVSFSFLFILIAEMKLVLFVASVVFCFGLISAGNVTARRPAFVHIGSIFTFNSTVGRAAKVAIDAAIDDINSNPSVLAGSKLVISLKDTNYSGFIGILEGKLVLLVFFLIIVGAFHLIIFLENNSYEVHGEGYCGCNWSSRI